MEEQYITVDDVADAYLSVVNQMFISRIKFMREGIYPSMSKEDVKKLYGNGLAMTKYMMGLALSQFLWGHHYNIFEFYKKTVSQMTEKNVILEVGSGHGLYTVEFLENVAGHPFMDVVDVSSISLEITKNVIKTLVPDCLRKMNFLEADILDVTLNRKYDFIIMGEVLEHVENPHKILARLFNLLDDNGVLFLSTCANSPAVDHFYHFKNIGQIQQMIKDAGFLIKDELVAPSENVSESEIERLKLDVLYAAQLCKNICYNSERDNI